MDLGFFRGALFDAITEAGPTDGPAFYLAPLGYPNMKFSILALGAAVAGISSQCAAQLHIESSFPTRAPEARLVSQQEPVGSSFSNEPNGNSEDTAYFAPTPPQAEITREQAVDSQSILSDEQSQAAAEQPLPNDPLDPLANESLTNQSLAPGGRPIKKQLAAAAPLHVLAMTPEVGMVPVCWQNAGGCPTPNPIADYMKQTWCSQGLWDGYACQRARQCAHIQQQMFGHNRYTCGGCAACGTGGVQHLHAAQPGCTSCGSTASQCAQNAPAASKQGISTPAQSLMATTTAPQSPLIGEMQAGLPVVDFNQVTLGTVPPAGYGQPAQLTTAPATNRLPNGQPLLQLPGDVPTVPQDAVTPAMPMFPSVMPALPVPAATPVVASRPSASLR